MDIELLERLGVPVAVAGASMWFIYRQTQFIQKFFMDDLNESQKRLESIIVTLIGKQKELEQRTMESLADMRSSYESLVEVITALSGNGLKKREKEEEEKTFFRRKKK